MPDLWVLRRPIIVGEPCANVSCAADENGSGGLVGKRKCLALFAFCAHGPQF